MMGRRRRRSSSRCHPRLFPLALSLQLLLSLKLRLADSLVAFLLLPLFGFSRGTSGGLGGLSRFVLRLLFDHPLFDFLLLLQGLHEGRLQAVRVFGFECLFRVGSDARFANDVLAARFFSLPNGRVIGAALDANKRRKHVFDVGRRMPLFRRVVVFDVLDDLFEADEQHEFGSVGVGDEIQLGRRRFRRWNLKQSFFQLFP